MDTAENFSTEIFFTPAWHWSLSSFFGDLKGEVGYIDEYGLVHLLGKKDPDITKNHVVSRTDGPVKCITANKSMGIL